MYIMPRSARIILPHTPHHIVQRGHNRQTVFVSDDDYNYYRENLIEFKREFNCRIYAYCLMTNHVHLIVDPGDRPESLSMLMKRQISGMSSPPLPSNYLPGIAPSPTRKCKLPIASRRVSAKDRTSSRFCPLLFNLLY